MRIPANARVTICVLVTLLITAAPSQGADSGPLALEELAGRPVSLSLAAGDTAIVVHFWAIWCPTCVEELGVLDAAARACTSDVRVVAVNVGEELEKIRAFLAARPIALRQLRDGSGDVWRSVSGRGLPLNLIWTPEGRRLEFGPRDAEDWRQTLAEVGCR